MNVESPSVVEVSTSAHPSGTVIWLHGLGADGHDFEPIVPQLSAAGATGLRYVFPHAPVRPVTLNGGMAMRAWYDILGLDRNTAQDEQGIRGADGLVRALISREQQRGIATQRVVLAGFSQGGAMALYSGTRYPHKLAGIVGLSCYLPLRASFAVERQPCNQATPIFLAHGSLDPVVDYEFGEDTRELLQAAGYPLEWHAYPMGHAVGSEEVVAIGAFLARVL